MSAVKHVSAVRHVIDCATRPGTAGMCRLVICAFVVPCADPEGEGGRSPDPPPLKNRKIIGFLSKTGPDPLKNYKSAFNFGPSLKRQRNAI